MIFLSLDANACQNVYTALSETPYRLYYRPAKLDNSTPLNPIARCITTEQIERTIPALLSTGFTGGVPGQPLYAGRIEMCPIPSDCDGYNAPSVHYHLGGKYKVILETNQGGFAFESDGAFTNRVACAG